MKNAKVRYASSGLQCVPFARTASGIEIKGNAANWWDSAAGVYERGSRPEAGSVLNFRATGGMRLGHVAVVTAVLDSRHVVIDHANWTKGVSRDVPVVDTSANNDWSAVRVGLARGSDYGSVYPTYGFIYDRPDRGTMVANASAADHATPGGAVADMSGFAYQEVAELPRRKSHTRPILRLDLPERSFQ